MKTYVFDGFLISGSGFLSTIDKFSRSSDCVFCSEDYTSCCVDILLNPLPSAGLFRIEVSCSSDLKNALRRLKSFLLIESFDFYFDFCYRCISDSGVSTRYFRNSHRLLNYFNS